MGQMKKYSIALPIFIDRIIATNGLCRLALVTEDCLRMALRLIDQEKEIDRLEQERAELQIRLGVLSDNLKNPSI